jgi:hypothetical protein
MLDGEGEGRKAEADGIEDCPKRKLAVQWLTGLGKKSLQPNNFDHCGCGYLCVESE